MVAALQSVPCTGGLAHYLQRYYPDQNKRLIADMVECLHGHAQEIDEVRCDLARLACLVNEISIQSLRTPSEAKRAALRGILFNYASGKSAKDHEVDAMVQAVAGLTELQIDMLKRGEGVPDGDEYKLKYGNKEPLVVPYFPGVAYPVILGAYLGLLERGLVRQSYRGTPRTADRLTLWHLVHTELAVLLLEWTRPPHTEPPSP